VQRNRTKRAAGLRAATAEGGFDRVVAGPADHRRDGAQERTKETKDNKSTGTVTAPANPATATAEQYDYE